MHDKQQYNLMNENSQDATNENSSPTKLYRPDRNSEIDCERLRFLFGD